MFSIQKLLGKEDKFFDLLEASAEEARSSVQALVRIVKSSTAPPTLEEFVLPRRKEKRIAQEISEQLVNTFITGLEREDIEALSTDLYKIPKATEKWAEHFILGAQKVRDVDFTRQVGMLEQARRRTAPHDSVNAPLPALWCRCRESGPCHATSGIR